MRPILEIAYGQIFVCVRVLSCVPLFVIPLTEPMEFSRQDYWNRFPFPSLVVQFENHAKAL